MPSRNVTLGYSRYESWSFGVQISPVRPVHTHMDTHTHRALSANPFFALSRQGKCPVTRHHGLWLPARGGAFPLPLHLLLLFPLSPLMKPERRKEAAHARLDSNRGDGSPYPFSVTTWEKIYSGNLAPSTRLGPVPVCKQPSTWGERGGEIDLSSSLPCPLQLSVV